MTTTLVAYASKHGSTREIAQRIADRLSAGGLATETLPVESVGKVESYDAVVLGSALYMFHWMGTAKSFVGRNRRALGSRPLWLFSSGPIGPEVDEKGNRQLDVCGPRERDELDRTLRPRDHRVFFGAWSKDNKPIGFWENMVRFMPAARDSMPYGDFRDWQAIEAWADGIAAELRAAKAASR